MASPFEFLPTITKKLQPVIVALVEYQTVVSIHVLINNIAHVEVSARLYAPVFLHLGFECRQCPFNIVNQHAIDSLIICTWRMWFTIASDAPPARAMSMSVSMSFCGSSFIRSHTAL